MRRAACPSTPPFVPFAIGALLLWLPFQAPAPALAGTGARISLTSPVDGARLVRPETGILVRFATPLDATDTPSLAVTGSLSGSHPGRTIVADGGQALLFRPARAFAPGEQVTVTVGATPRVVFTIAPMRAPLPTGAEMLARALDDPLARVVNQALVPSARAAQPSPVPLYSPAPAAEANDGPITGRLFLAPFTGDGSAAPYLLIQNDTGPLTFIRQMLAPCLDFKVQPNGLLTYFDSLMGKFYAMDNTYTVVDSFACGNGFPTDLHELRILPNGHALLLATDPEIVDMSTVVPGGNAAATVFGNVIQELDQDKNVVFEWRTFDHFAITDATHENLTANAIDYVHANALELDSDGNILLSSRHMDEITKIDRSTGDILWRFGGKHNQFTLAGDTLFFSHQHAIRRIANGDVTLFDNGNFHTPPYSRAVEYTLDEGAKIATLTWQFRSTPDDFGSAMGYVERLDDGSTLVSYGTGNPDLYQVTSNGTVAISLTLPGTQMSYRVARLAYAPLTGVGDPRPGSLALSNALPNPFRNASSVFLTLAQPAHVTLGVYDVQGRKVLDVLDHAARGAGVFRLPVDLGAAPAGIYFARVTTELGSVSRRLVKLD